MSQTNNTTTGDSTMTAPTALYTSSHWFASSKYTLRPDLEVNLYMLTSYDPQRWRLAASDPAYDHSKPESENLTDRTDVWRILRAGFREVDFTYYSNVRYLLDWAERPGNMSEFSRMADIIEANARAAVDDLHDDQPDPDTFWEHVEMLEKLADLAATVRGEHRPQ